MRAEHFFYFNNSRTKGEDLVPVKCIQVPGDLGCCPFYGDGSVVVTCCLLLLPLWASVLFYVLVYVTLYPF